jgi:ATP-dependent DNA helicase RecG
MNIDSSVEEIHGVGKTIANELRTAGFTTVKSLIYFFPRNHEDYSKIERIADVQPGRVIFKAKCESVFHKQVRRGLNITTAVLYDDSGKMRAVWFNQPYRIKQLKCNKEFLFSGNLEFSYNKYQLSNPSVQLSDESVMGNENKIMPVYRQLNGIKNNVFYKIISSLKNEILSLEDNLPRVVIDSEKLISHARAVYIMHFPDNSDDLEKAKERLAFEELFFVTLSSQLNKSENQKLKGRKILFDANVIKSIISKLPFKLTNAQRIAIWEMVKDLESGVPMNRLLQGDVGSGKTVVAAVIACLASKNGFQTAFMAPTEILAEQHKKTLQKILSPLDITVSLLTSGVKGKKRAELYDDLSKGNIDIIVGTHALLQKELKFKELGLVVIDEQHRFGVKQRQELISKSSIMPHLLSMTATPIPRSLALTSYGELDMSILNEQPIGRKKIKTKICSPNSLDEIYKLVRDELDKKHQAYFICSLIDDNQDNDVQSVASEYDKLKKSLLKTYNIATINGKQKSSEKNKIMEDFLSGSIDILISTTVVEVGVDAPNATVIAIENADHFGLAQLHQLRGRVGRSDQQGYCYLINSNSLKPSNRLNELVRSNDGFYLAEADLRLRGPGEMYGSIQHGSLDMKVADINDVELILRTRKCARKLIDNNFNLKDCPQIIEKINYYRRITVLN